ncbi:hypothetical protein CULT_400019 [[Clostridium] ultunense Esp]|nr:hypothetical protein CULT_400019 [[Clostridium] ultunense Esp]
MIKSRGKPRIKTKGGMKDEKRSGNGNGPGTHSGGGHSGFCLGGRT